MKKNQSYTLKNCPVCNSSRLVVHINTIHCLNCNYECITGSQLKLDWNNENKENSNRASGADFERRCECGNKVTSRAKRCHSCANKERWKNQDYKVRTGRKISEGLKKCSYKGENHSFYGKHHSEESKEKIRNSEYHKNFGRSGKDNYNWKGDEVMYGSLHTWIGRNFKKPSSCELCGTEKKKLEWSNKDHKYSRKRKDWQFVCRSCHRRYDFEHNR